MKKENYYTAKNLADRFGMNVMTIYRYIKAKKIKAYKIGKEFRISEGDLERFLKKTYEK